MKGSDGRAERRDWEEAEKDRHQPAAGAPIFKAIYRGDEQARAGVVAAIGLCHGDGAHDSKPGLIHQAKQRNDGQVGTGLPATFGLRRKVR